MGQPAWSGSASTPLLEEWPPPGLLPVPLVYFSGHCAENPKSFYGGFKGTGFQAHTSLHNGGGQKSISPLS